MNQLKAKNKWETFRIKVVTLKEGSWYGDYQIMVFQNSAWQLKAGKAAHDQKGMTGKIAANKVQVFELRSHHFNKIINSYPSFRRFVLTRANLRRTSWMKILDENIHLWLLEKKISE